jgi:hypothetical protein
LERFDSFPVPSDVPEELFSPKRTARLRERRLSTTVVLMPKASVDEDDLAAGRKDNVGTSRQIAAMEPKSISERVCKPSDHFFRLGVLPPNSRHQSATLGRDRRLYASRRPRRTVTSHELSHLEP